MQKLYLAWLAARGVWNYAIFRWAPWPTLSVRVVKNKISGCFFFRNHVSVYTPYMVNLILKSSICILIWRHMKRDCTENTIIALFNYSYHRDRCKYQSERFPNLEDCGSNPCIGKCLPVTYGLFRIITPHVSKNGKHRDETCV